MSIARVNPSGWSNGQNLLDGYANKLDLNSTYELDKRAGHTDTLGSAVTLASGGGMTLNSGSSLIAVPSSITIGTGNLKSAATLIGSGSPITRGSIVKTFADTTDYTLTSDGYVQTLTFNGAISGSKNITFPNFAGYRMQVINNTGATLKCSASSGTTTSSLYPGQSVIFYCDGTNIRSLGKRSNANYQLVSMNQFYIPNILNGFVFVNYQNILGTPNSIPFVDGDVFEIIFHYDMTLILTTSSSITGPQAMGSLVPNVLLFATLRADTINFTELSGTNCITSQSATTIYYNTRNDLHTLLSVTGAGFAAFNLSYNAASAVTGVATNSMSINKPTGLTIKQWRIS